MGSRDRFLENLWRRKFGLPEIQESAPPTIEQIYKENWSFEFERYMRNRLAMGYFRYGPLKKQRKGQFDNIGSIRKRLGLYELDGNDEHLVDCANLCMVEFMNGNHPKKHFSSVDDGVHVEAK